jgi:hypothetical protein
LLKRLEQIHMLYILQLNLWLFLLAFGVFNLVTGISFKVVYYAMTSVFWFLGLLKGRAVKTSCAMVQELLCILFNFKALCSHNRDMPKLLKKYINKYSLNNGLGSVSRLTNLKLKNEPH